MVNMLETKLTFSEKRSSAAIGSAYTLNPVFVENEDQKKQTPKSTQDFETTLSRRSEYRIEGCNLSSIHRRELVAWPNLTYLSAYCVPRLVR